MSNDIFSKTIVLVTLLPNLDAKEPCMMKQEQFELARQLSGLKMTIFRGRPMKEWVKG